MPASFTKLCEFKDVAAHTERGIDLPKLVNEKHQTGEGRRRSGVLTNELSKSFPAINDSRGNEISLWPAQSRNPELQSNGPRSYDCRIVSFGQATVKTLKDMLLNVIVIEKNCSTSVMKSPGLWGNMALVSSLWVSCEGKIHKIIPQQCNRQTCGYSIML